MSLLIEYARGADIKNTGVRKINGDTRYPVYKYIDIENHFHYNINIKYAYGNNGFKEEKEHEKTFSSTSSRSES